MNNNLSENNRHYLSIDLIYSIMYVIEKRITFAALNK